MENKFNLIYESWIPVVNYGKVGLWQIFSDDNLKNLGGNPIEKISVFKLLLAIAQSAFTPKDEDEWKSVGKEGLRKKVLEYLEKNKDLFWLYGDKPFLQMKEISNVKNTDEPQKLKEILIGCGTYPDPSPDNNTVVSNYETRDISFDDAARALYLISTLNFAFYGKQVDKNIHLDSNLKKGIAKPGASLGFYKFLHSFILGDSILQSIYMNWFSETVVSNLDIYDSVGTPFWEEMPKKETCDVAQKSKKTLIGHLVPLSRFAYFTNKGMFFAEGIFYHFSKKEKKEGLDDGNWKDTSISWKIDNGEIKYISCDVSKRPWRILTAYLSGFIKNTEYENLGIKVVFNRLQSLSLENITVWSGGIDVDGDTFGFKVKEKNDYVESEVQIPVSVFFNDKESTKWHSNLNSFFEKIETCANFLKKSFSSYFLELEGKSEDKNKEKYRKQIIEKRWPKISESFWGYCENYFQNISDICSGENAQTNLEKQIKKFYSFAYQLYDEYCPRDTARQMEAWANNRFRKKGGEINGKRK